ncbi:MAG: cytochrome c maturation protein CcmE [Gammaproteobacteria bacterium]
MTARQKTRLLIALAVCLGAAATVFLATAAFRQNMLFFYTPSQLLARDIPKGDFRLGGLVGEVLPPDGSLETRFIVSDNTVAITVSYRGVLPDLFREGQGVVVRGKWQSGEEGGMVKAGEVLAKHDENYMPPPLRDLRPRQ